MNAELWLFRVVALGLLLGGAWGHGYQTGKARAVAVAETREAARLSSELAGVREGVATLVGAVRDAAQAEAKAVVRAAQDRAQAARWRRAYEESKNDDSCAVWAAAPVPCRLHGPAGGDDGGPAGADPTPGGVPVAGGAGLGP